MTQNHNSADKFLLTTDAIQIATAMVRTANCIYFCSLESGQKSTKTSKRQEVSTVIDASASKRAGPLAAVLANPKVQEAVVEKGIEIKLDITPDKGWESEDMFLPPGYHIDASISGGEKSPTEVGVVPYVFPAGIGAAMMNGCWGTDYKETDPCYSAKFTSKVCKVKTTYVL
ncbi:hypothetical protein OS493_032526 [Desmophyllum pertusum]|uniref:Uncharacterized protein n=1 Tax=Desmophyllum pertusum TaxID=174260 RepID=A0A9W9Z861_9CNID|nr:hypothetical protein OS493_032526 [Desmophyllum pertusum]